MINYNKFTLKNGLKVIVHKDETTPLVAFNLIYNVGARDENPEKTGFAHLFEHLMFEGSKNIPNYDSPLQTVSGTNNAFTNNDFTNYYITLPKENIETAFWLESDRMLELAFSEKKLEIQKNVVIEEYKERYLNQPYGNDTLLLRDLAYKVHPYRWSTIGKTTKHIEDVTLQDVKDFFHKHYAPNNAILSIAGNVEVDDIKKLAEKWFAPIEPRNVAPKNIPKEPKQIEQRRLTVKEDVPFNAIYIAFPYFERLHPKYHATDLLSDVLANGDSSRFYQKLVKENNIFTEIDAYITGSIDKGIFIIDGKPAEGVSMETAEKEIWKELENIKNELINDYELQKVKNSIESTMEFSKTSILDKAITLGYYELLENVELINTEQEKYNNVTLEIMKETANDIFQKTNSSVLYYLSN